MLYATHADVRLDNIEKNPRRHRRHVGPEQKILIAVKANGYGHGAVEISQRVERTGAADWLGVATTPEGV